MATQFTPEEIIDYAWRTMPPSKRYGTNEPYHGALNDQPGWIGSAADFIKNNPVANWMLESTGNVMDDWKWDQKADPFDMAMAGFEMPVAGSAAGVVKPGVKAATKGIGSLMSKIDPKLATSTAGTASAAYADDAESAPSFKKLWGIPKSAVTIRDPQRAAYPGIYSDPRDIAWQAAQNVAPENPAMERLFGVTRDDLYEMHKGRVGNEAPKVKLAAKPKGSAAGERILTGKNTQRMLDVLGEAENYPELYKGMDSWYEMQPLFDQFKQISDNPVEDFWRFQSMTGMASPGSDVLTEINRGTGALSLANQGRFDDFLNFGGMAGDKRIEGAFPEDMRGIMGHPYHSTAQGKPMSKFLETGNLEHMDSPKVPLYIHSAGVPETGFQTRLPVGDAHFSRATGLADARTNKDYGASISTPELQTIGDWWGKDVAGELGINSVDAQARAWGTFAPQTGVDTPVGAPKLELIAQKIMDASRAYGISPEQARDMILKGEMYAPNLGLMGL